MAAREVTGGLHCPRCDAPLSNADAEPHPTRCPNCNVELVGVTVANRRQRVAAAVLDLLVVGVTAGPLHLGLRALIGGTADVESHGLDAFLRFGAQDLGALVFGQLPLLLMAGLYHALFLGLVGHTPGMRALGIRVVRTDGQILHPVMAAWRYVAALIGLLPGTLGFWWLLVDPDRRAFHDHLAGTYVVRAT